ncbi:DUF3515 domain-containing protein [Streptacidiphilus fuscans]|uniref:DUF3515 domain-containing protein n=1 Tax=Streptacidiphilus fuscans TaxID=2789292 RepID=A0A931FA69_9ACTN|nr:DUF3515 domain-containing protein [Streptacidiphilus fuscans]MBF9067337.1 DUF3515 domain-containing protein [Streptacidiphilus fuscans]
MTRFAASSALLAAAALSLTACGGGGGGSVPVSAPRTTGVVAQDCTALSKTLPKTLMGLSRRDTSPASPNTAAWGDPAVTLRCGAGLPGIIDPASKDYDPEGENVSGALVGSVCWVSVYNQSDRSFTFSAADQQAIVEVDVPSAYAGKQSPLTELSGIVAKASPFDSDKKFNCSNS